MAKTFAKLVGWLLIVIGVLDFFVGPVKLLPAHGILHIVVGLLGVWGLKRYAGGYALWVGIVGVVLAVVGFLGLKNLLGIIDLPAWTNVLHLVLGAWGLWAAMAGRKAGAPAGPGPGGPTATV